MDGLWNQQILTFSDSRCILSQVKHASDGTASIIVTDALDALLISDFVSQSVLGSMFVKDLFLGENPLLYNNKNKVR